MPPLGSTSRQLRAALTLFSPALLRNTSMSAIFTYACKGGHDVDVVAAIDLEQECGARAVGEVSACEIHLGGALRK
jgi:hypothetical protein